MKIHDNLVTYLEDPAIQDPALGDVDTSTRVQTTWQVLLHKLESEEIPKEEQNDENRWSPWNPLGLNDQVNNDIESDVKIGIDNNGELLEVFALSKLPLKHRISLRQLRADPVQWEDNWENANDEISADEFDIATKHVDELEILHTFGIGGSLQQVTFNYFIRDNGSRWGRRLPGPPAEFTDIGIDQIKLIMDSNNNLYAFAFTHKFLGIVYSRQDPISLKWDIWRGAGHGNRDFDIFRVILNLDTKCFEVYTANKRGIISYTKQKDPNSNDWTEWTEIDLDLRIVEFDVIFNRKNQVVVFINDRYRRGFT